MSKIYREFSAALIVAAGCMNDFIGVALASLIAVYIVLTRWKITKSPVVYATFAMFLIVIVHAQFPNQTPYSVRFEEAVRMFGGFALALTFARIPLNSLANATRYVCYLTVAPIPLYLMLGLFSRADESGNIRYTSLFVHPNHVAYVSVILITITVIARQQIYGAENRKFWLVMGALLLSLGLSESSAGVLTLGAVSIAYIVFYASLPKKVIYAVIGALLVLVLFLATPIGSSLIEKFVNVDLSRIRAGSVEHQFGGQNSSLAWRLSYWMAIFREHISHDFASLLHGYGGGSTSKGNYIFYFMYKDPHNDFLAFIVDYGIIWGTMITLLLILPTAFASHGAMLLLAILLPMQTGNIATEFPVVTTYLLAVSLAIRLKSAQTV